MPWATQIKRQILLVDDEPAILLALKAILEINGFAVHTAASVREAIQRLRRHTYQMVITDMQMEEPTSGLSIVEAAKTAPSQPAVAMLTAYPMDGAEWREAGLDEMLLKPMNVTEMIRQIEALLVSQEDKKQRAAIMARISKPEAVRPLVGTGRKPAKKAAKKKTAKQASTRKTAARS